MITLKNMDAPVFMDDLEQFIGLPVSEEVLIKRNYFQCHKGKLLRYNTEVILKDFPDLESSIIHGVSDIGEQPSSATVMKYIAKSLYKESRKHQDELFEDEPEYGDVSWIKCLPMPPKYMSCQSYIVIQIYLDQDSKISFFRMWMRLIEGGNPFFCIPGDCSNIESSYRPIPFFPPEVIREIGNLCDGKYLPQDFSFIGQRITSEMRQDLHLDCGNEDEYFFYNMSGFVNINNTICITVDDKESNIITGLEAITSINDEMVMKPIDADTDKLDILDCLTIMHDYIEEE